MNIACVILAAGLGKRMKSKLPKVLHTVCGMPMLRLVINTAKKIKPAKIIIVVGEQRELIEKAVDSKGVIFTFQKEAKGTGHALLCAGSALKNFNGVVVVLNGDAPLLNPNTIKKFLSLHKRGKNSISVLSFIAGKADNYGRVVRDASGKVLSIIEHKDLDMEQKKITEVNSGVYAVNHDALDILNEIRMNKAKGEYYLTDIIASALKRGLKTSAYRIGKEDEFMGVNTREELNRASMLMRKNIIRKWIDKGVNFLDSGSVLIHPDVFIGDETTIYPNVCIEGQTKIGRRAVIYPNVRILNGDIGDDVTIKDSTVIEGSRIRDKASVGPFARLRPGSDVGQEAGIGNFVEIKKSVIGDRTKAAHLSYIGDAIVGKDVNVGAGTITCNYDGKVKHKTRISDNVFIGSDTQFIAPVSIGRGAYIGAGSTITEDVPPMSLAMSRVKQTNVKDWARKRQLKVKSEKLKVKGEKDKG